MAFSVESTEAMYRQIRNREYRGLIGSNLPEYAVELVGGPCHGESGPWTHTLEPDKLVEQKYQFVILVKENGDRPWDVKPWDVIHRYILLRKDTDRGELLMYAYYDGMD